MRGEKESKYSQAVCNENLHHPCVALSCSGTSDGRTAGVEQWLDSRWWCFDLMYLCM